MAKSPKSRRPGAYPKRFRDLIHAAIEHEVLIPCSTEERARDLVGLLNNYKRSAREWQLEGASDIVAIGHELHETLDVLEAGRNYRVNAQTHPYTLVLTADDGFGTELRSAQIQEIPKEDSVPLPAYQYNPPPVPEPKRTFDMSEYEDDEDDLDKLFGISDTDLGQ